MISFKRNYLNIWRQFFKTVILTWEKGQGWFLSSLIIFIQSWATTLSVESIKYTKRQSTTISKALVFLPKSCCPFSTMAQKRTFKKTTPWLIQISEVSFKTFLKTSNSRINLFNQWFSQDQMAINCKDLRHWMSLPIVKGVWIAATIAQHWGRGTSHQQVAMTLELWLRKRSTSTSERWYHLITTVMLTKLQAQMVWAMLIRWAQRGIWVCGRVQGKVCQPKKWRTISNQLQHLNRQCVISPMFWVVGDRQEGINNIVQRSILGLAKKFHHLEV